MLPFIEKVQLGKVLLMQDLNLTKKFVGKKLSEIDFPEIITTHEARGEKDVTQDDVGTETTQPASMNTDNNSSDESQDECEVRPKRRKLTKNSNDNDDKDYDFQDEEGDDDDDDDDDDEECDGKPPKKRAKKAKKAQATCSRKTWTVQEVQEIRKYLGFGKTPGKKDIMIAMKNSREDGGVLHLRPWEKIKKKISADIQKTKV